ncbi:protein COFACTOR ASSEMBLY OF COMPLEX C SUBUNIT B CCB4, chloroplastic, partial [Fagus crenata]
MHMNVYISDPICISPYVPVKLRNNSCTKPMVVQRLDLSKSKASVLTSSRADLLTLGLAVTNILTGLVWLSIRPKSISVISPLGVECRRIYSHLPESVVSKLLWVWESLSDVTCCRSLIIVYDSQCILQIGFATKSSIGDEAVAVDANKLMQGSLYQGVIKSGA